MAMILLCKRQLKGAKVVETHKKGLKTIYTKFKTFHASFIASYVASKIRN